MKLMREHHPMRYNRITEILRALTEIKLSTSFLLKSYFLSNPMLVLLVLYMFNVFVIGYLVFSMERSNGTCTMYIDVVWMMSVTITNLGFGDFTPSFWLSPGLGKFLPKITLSFWSQEKNYFIFLNSKKNYFSIFSS